MSRSRNMAPSHSFLGGAETSLGLPMLLWTWHKSWGGWVQCWKPDSDTPSQQASSKNTLVRYFHDVVDVMEQMARSPEGYQERLEEIYNSLLGSESTRRPFGGGKRPVGNNWWVQRTGALESTSDWDVMGRTFGSSRVAQGWRES